MGATLHLKVVIYKSTNYRFQAKTKTIAQNIKIQKKLLTQKTLFDGSLVRLDYVIYVPLNILMQILCKHLTLRVRSKGSVAYSTKRNIVRLQIT